MASDTFFAPYEQAKNAHLIRPTGGLKGEIFDLREDVSDGFARVDAVVGARSQKNPVRMATAAALGAYVQAGTGPGATLTQVAAAVEAIDGVTPVVGDRVLVKDGSAGEDNGIYTVTVVGTGVIKQVLTRAVDFDDAADVVSGAIIPVTEGTAHDNTIWMLTTNNPITLDTTPLLFQEVLTDLVPTKDPVRLATAAALGACTAAGTGPGKTLTQDVAAIENIDGVAPVAGDRVLIKDQAAQDDNGIYVVTTVGTGVIFQVLTRATDFDDDADVVSNVTCRVEEGATNALTMWYLSTVNPIVVDTTNLVFLSSHAADHIDGARDAIDGDNLGITWVPATYARNAAPAEAANVTSLTAHLRGVDDLLTTHAATLAARDRKDNVRLATAAALGACTPTGTGVGKILTQDAGAVEDIDGVALVVGDRILVKDQAAQDDNGIYTVTVVGDATPTQQVLTRAVDADTDAKVTAGMFTRVEEGTANAGTIWYLTTVNPIVLDTTNLVFSNIPNLHMATHLPGGGDALTTAAPVDISGANAEGAAASFSRSNHVHKLALLNSHLAHQMIAPFGGVAAAAGAINARRTFDFDDGLGAPDEQICCEGIMPEHYSGGDITVVLTWYGTDVALGDVKWDVSWERIEAGVLLLTGDSFAGVQTSTVTQTAINVALETPIVFTQAQADGIVPGDAYRILIMRDSNDAGDTCVGDVGLLAVHVYQ